MRQLFAAISLTLLAPVAYAQQTGPVPLYTNLGSWTHRISSRVTATQAYFDQGLRLTYGFNHGEAIRAFREAARLDSTCAICWWGVANAYGPNINLPMDSASGAAAYEASQRALALRLHASPVEREYIEAQSRRYGRDPVAGRAGLDSAYATAMHGVARHYPADLDAAALAAEAAMDLRPWNYWAPDGSAYPGVNEIIESLEIVLRRNADHPGACHYYIHMVEASPRPERALPCARRLASLIPGAGHLVHMPAHIYIRLGMYAEAQQANIHAAHTDESYIADVHPDGIYAVAYYPHNLHFLWAAAAFSGRRADADTAIARLRAAAPAELAVQIPPLELYIVPPLYHMIWFSEWDNILREPRPPAPLVMTTGLWFYARGRAFAATGRLADAHAMIDSLTAQRRGAAANIPPGITLGFASPAAILDLAANMLEGDVAARERRFDEAVARLEDAVRGADALTYNEPADWYPSPRLTLGAVLLDAGRAADAEAAYRADLVHNRNSGWALTGLERALRAQGKTPDAETVHRQLLRAWPNADAQ